MIKVIIFGTGDNSQVAHHYLSEDDRYNVVAFTLDKNFLKKAKFESKPVIEFEKLAKFYPPDEYKLFIPIGYSNNNELREQKYLEAKTLGYKFISYISPRAFVASNVEIGENCFILEDNTIQPFVNISDNCIIWSGNHIGHHSSIGSNCFISSHVVISGGCKIGKNTFLGVNSTIRNHINIGSYNIVGMGATVTRSTEDFDVFIENGTEKSPKSSKEVDL